MKRTFTETHETVKFPQNKTSWDCSTFKGTKYSISI